MLSKINIIILFSYSLCELFSYYNFNIEIIDISNCIFIKTFNKYKVLRSFCKILRFLLQNINKVYAL